ncbi:MAG: hypothetical protein COC24_005770 [Alphaproteobacteria bacterium]|nr:hypothetical protein [Alphaproteobacteria bacterium]
MNQWSLKRWWHNRKSIIIHVIEGVALFWLFVEIASYSTSGEVDSFLKKIWVFSLAFVIILIISFVLNKPKNSFAYKLRAKDSFIEIKVGDAFKNRGALVIPFNDHLDVSLGGNVKKSKSLQSQLIRKYYSGREEHLESDIFSKIDKSQAPVAIGTTIEIAQNNKTFYLLVNSRKKTNNRVESNEGEFMLSIAKLWRYISSESGRNSNITIPLLSTDHGRINTNRVAVIKEIIDSYIYVSKHKNVSDRLIISIHPSDLEKGDIDLDDLDEFLKFSCKHYKEVTYSDEPEGQAISSSVTNNIAQ